MDTNDASVPTGTLFDLGKPSAQSPPDGSTREASPRLRLAERQQGEFRMVVVDQMLATDHPVRAVWHYVCGLDLGPLLDQIVAVEGKPGRDATDPRILLCLWLFATLEGIGSARALDRLCHDRLEFLWICGGVSLNYHTLADFRTQHVEFLDRLLTHSVAALRAEGLVDLNRVAQDGLRVRASAGTSSFRRRQKLTEYLHEAQEQVRRLRAELETDPGTLSKRQQAARERAAADRLQRVQQALTELAKVEEARAVRGQESKDQARASSTDPEARSMKMPDGGFRPAYNAQFATDTASRLIVGVDVTNQGNDGGQMGPMIEQIKERHAKVPDQYLVDGGFATHDDIDEVTREHGTIVYAPVRVAQKKLAAGQDPYARQKRDTEAVAAWRQRMAQPEAKLLYTQRAATAEWTNAQARNRGLYQVRVRGLVKVKAVLLWYALVHNLMQGLALRASKQA
jgi:transposase